MSIGPVEYIELAFPGNQFNGEILPALQDLVEKNIISIIDLVIVKKDADGTITIAELSELTESEAAILEPLRLEISELLNSDDLILLAEALEPNYTAAVMVWEDKWATRFADAVRDAGGVLVANERVPRDAVMAAIEVAQLNA